MQMRNGTISDNVKLITEKECMVGANENQCRLCDRMDTK